MRKLISLSVAIAFIFSLFFAAGCNDNNYKGNTMELYKISEGASSRWASFENPTAEKGKGAILNEGGKGYPYHLLKPGETVTLLDVKGPGIVQRIWMTLDHLFNIPDEMRAVRIDMYWDNNTKPAVSVPLADFFCASVGKMSRFENELFASPEAKSFVCYIPMPYRSAARITLTNESKKLPHRVFYDVNFLKLDKPENDALYFHAYWHRETPTTLGEDFRILPRVNGKGRFLGTSIGVIVDKRNVGWWGEGEAKIYLDGDSKHPTLCGTGTEDYISTGWGQGVFNNRFHGSLVSDKELGLYSFYRFHIPDTVQFAKDCEVAIQQMGGTAKKHVKKMMEDGLKVKPVCVIKPDGVQYNLLGKDDFSFDDEQFTEDMWTNYYRQDDVCAVAYFYLDSPVNDLPPLAPVQKRIENLKTK